MIENMTVISNLHKRKYPSFEKGWALFISKRKYLYHIERKVNRHFEATVNPSSRNESRSSISKRELIVISKRQSSSFRKDSQSIISKRQCRIISKR